MRRDFAIGFSLALLFGGCFSAPVDLGLQSKSSAHVVVGEARQAGRRSAMAVEACCIAVEWSFKDDDEPAIAAGETVSFRLSIDGVDQPQYAQTLKVASSRSVVQLRFSTVIPADRFFNHNLLASLVRVSWTNREGQPSLTHGFVLGGQS